MASSILTTTVELPLLRGWPLVLGDALAALCSGVLVEVVFFEIVRAFFAVAIYQSTPTASKYVIARTEPGHRINQYKPRSSGNDGGRAKKSY